MSRPVGTASRPVRTAIAAAALSALIVFIGAESAAAGEQRSVVDVQSRTATTAPTPTPTSTPTPTPTTGTTHEQQNGEQPVERTDLGFLGVAFLFGIGFLLAAGALGILVSGRARRRRDRADAAAREEGSDVA
ncbi:hypothetical protein F6W69_03610 [Microbacterium oxydans]|uniref:hypothetical protein n=2 Tax=Microbacterium TaxID=33882 RepID=UPI0011428C53|nr:hypothetical protein [Microbacterium oxydans]KAB1893148.1 hypothetical protein F6W69_03610 [Microbacterium oxydans]GED37592.1 hypothetical protein MOX01_07340 [Microbacterium oxydans]